MSLSQALGTSISGLRATQAGLAIVAGNVANADTPGYLRKAPVQIDSTAGGFGSNVRVTGVTRELDRFIQRQLQVETSGGAYADLRAEFYGRLQDIYGDPGSDSTLESVFNSFTSALQGLATTPDSTATRSIVLSSARVLAQQLNGATRDIQALRSDAELGIADAVRQANEAMRQIAKINQELGVSTGTDAAAASLMDQRDNYVNQLSELMDIRVVEIGHNQISVFTNSGVQLVATQASQFDFDAFGTVTPSSTWSADPAQRTLGTIKLMLPNGGSTDLIATKAIRSGKIAGYLEMRDHVLPEAQAQLDEIAAALAKALSDRKIDGNVVTPGAQIDLDIGGMLAGNTIELTYTDTATNTQHRVTVVRVDDPAALPLKNTSTSDPNDTVLGVDFSGGMASVVAQLNSLLGSTSLQFSNPAGNTLRIMDDGGANRVDINAASANVTVTSLTSGGPELPFFVDGTAPYTGAITSLGPQSLGLAGRIAVNPGLLADPSRLIVFQTSPLTPSGDATRPNFIYQQLTGTTLAFSPRAGVGTTAAPFSGSLPSYIRQMLSQQGDAAQNAASLKSGQELVVNALQQRANDESGVNVDAEMAKLVSLQNAYAANARVMTTIRDLFDLLMKI